MHGVPKIHEGVPSQPPTPAEQTVPGAPASLRPDALIASPAVPAAPDAGVEERGLGRTLAPQPVAQSRAEAGAPDAASDEVSTGLTGDTATARALRAAVGRVGAAAVATRESEDLAVPPAAETEPHADGRHAAEEDGSDNGAAIGGGADAGALPASGAEAEPDEPATDSPAGGGPPRDEPPVGPDNLGEPGEPNEEGGEPDPNAHASLADFNKLHEAMANVVDLPGRTLLERSHTASATIGDTDKPHIYLNVRTHVSADSEDPADVEGSHARVQVVYRPAQATGLPRSVDAYNGHVTGTPDVSGPDAISRVVERVVDQVQADAPAEERPAVQARLQWAQRAAAIAANPDLTDKQRFDAADALLQEARDHGLDMIRETKAVHIVKAGDNIVSVSTHEVEGRPRHPDEVAHETRAVLPTGEALTYRITADDRPLLVDDVPTRAQEQFLRERNQPAAMVEDWMKVGPIERELLATHYPTVGLTNRLATVLESAAELLGQPPAGSDREDLPPSADA